MVDVVVMTLGSAGDLHPFLAIARALRERGAQVLLASQAPHEAEVRAQGVDFAAIASAEDQTRTLSHPQLWHPVRGLGVLWRQLVVPSIGPATALIESVARHNPGLRVLASPLAIGARLAADRWPVALTIAHLAPMSLRTLHDPMWLGNHRMPRAAPAWLRRAAWRGLDRWRLEPMARPALARWRETAGLPPIAGSVFGDWLLATQPGINHLGLWPAAYAAPQADWPAGFEAVGFPLYEPADETPLDASPCDVLLYPGSAPTPAQNAMAAAAKQLAARGVRARLLCPDQPRVDLPSALAATQVFVHHGGIGAIAQGLRAGVHQRVLPTAYDQVQNAWHLGRASGVRVSSSPTHLLADIDHDLAAPRLRPWPLELSAPGAPNTAVRAVVQRLLD